MTLEEQLQEAITAYYDGMPIMSDGEFDALEAKLKEENPNHPLLKVIGSDTLFGTKVKHIMTVGSQNKVANEEEFMAWPVEPPYVVEDKLDGASIELHYHNGVLIDAVTRGDGKYGESVLKNILKVPSIPKTIEYPKITAIRGEAVIHKDVFEKHFPDAKNPRNAVAGLLKRIDGVGCEHITFYAYDLAGLGLDIDSNYTVPVLLSVIGFLIPEYTACDFREDVTNLRNLYVGALREKLPYEIDGLVIKSTKRDTEDLKLNKPKKQVAFKFPLDEAATVLRDIEWSHTGQTFTPVAIFDPVNLHGTTVQRASLHNIDHMKELNIRIGKNVVVQKKGEIIPKIIRCISDEPWFDIPTNCDVCGAPLTKEGAFLICSNYKCKATLSHKIVTWFEVLDIKGVGPSLADYFAELYGSISNIYKDVVYVNESFVPQLNEQKVYTQMKEKKDLSLPIFIRGLAIPGIGETAVKNVMKAGYDTIEKMLMLDGSETINGVGQITINALVKGIEENLTEIYALMPFINIHKEIAVGSLHGEVFVITGELESMKRNDAYKLIEGAGGEVRTAVSKNTTYLVTNDPNTNTGKGKKARELGITIINEEEFLRMVV